MAVRRVFLLAVLAIAPLSVARASPVEPARASPDLVKLKNGGLLRGTISELVPNDRVVIILATGELRQVAMSEVEYAGPAGAEPGSVPAPAAPAPTPQPAAPSGATVRLNTNQPDLTYYLPAGKSIGTSVGASIGTGASFGVGTVGTTATSFHRLCIAPCTVQLVPGNHRFAVGIGEDAPVIVDETFAIEGTTTLTATYRSHAVVRIIGRIVSIGSLVAGLAVSIEWIVNHGGDPKPDFTQPAIGLGIALGGGVIGLILSSVDDGASITRTP
ncbi:MAG: hypothetical protein IT384_03090 [Deltaproteobacteria bacterium]|nr:hypothetical protein [Deltaproteobacteria bacterium]